MVGQEVVVFLLEVFKLFEHPRVDHILYITVIELAFPRSFILETLSVSLQT